MTQQKTLIEASQHLADEWHLTELELMAESQCSLVYSCLDSAGQGCVLKMPDPDAEERLAYPVLRAFAGHGGVTVLKVDERTGSLLMPRLRPGHELEDAPLSEKEKIDACAELILKLREAPIVPTIGIEQWLRELFIETSDSLVREAQQIALDLLASTNEEVLLHGDLHHYNILAGEEGWTAIDPKGILGDPAFEIVGYIRNPVPKPPGPDVMDLRLNRFAEVLGYERKRLWGWAFVQTLLCWLQGGGSDWGSNMRKAAEDIYSVR